MDGFSTADKELLYLPVDESEAAVSVEKQLNDDKSLLNTVKEIIALRHKYVDLQADGTFEVISSKKDEVFIYKRGELIILVNPKNKPVSYNLDVKDYEKIYEIGGIDNDCVKPQSFLVLKNN